MVENSKLGMVALVSFLQFNLICKIESWMILWSHMRSTLFCNAIRTQPEIGSKSAGNYFQKNPGNKVGFPYQLELCRIVPIDCTYQKEDKT